MTSSKFIASSNQPIINAMTTYKMAVVACGPPANRLLGFRFFDVDRSTDGMSISLFTPCFHLLSPVIASLLVYIISPINIYVDTQHRFKLRVCVFARLPAHICSSSGSGHRGSLRLQQPVTLQRAILRWP